MQETHLTLACEKTIRAKRDLPHPDKGYLFKKEKRKKEKKDQPTANITWYYVGATVFAT